MIDGMESRPVEVEGEQGGGNAAEVFAAFLKLGLTSFGGPIAHLGYFRDEFVVRRRWLDDRAYADLVALCQFLPGPASSQVGFALGLMRAGWAGALAAFVAFTLPSALILFGFAITATAVAGPIATGILHGLKIVAVAIVAQAVWGMAQKFCADRKGSAIAVAAVALLAYMPGSAGMISAIVIGAILGLVLRGKYTTRAGGEFPVPVSPRISGVAIAAFIALLVLLPVAAQQSQTLAVIDSFYRAGALVFGGGHVVLPLLDAGVVQNGWVSPDAFLSGYGAAQAVPGPLFTFATYLGAVLSPEPNGAIGAAIATLAIFLPGFLVLVAVLPFWDRFRSMPRTQSLMQGANAAVVGILGAALYSPVFTGSIFSLRDLALALGCFVALMVWRVAPWIVVALSGFAGAVLTLAG